MSDYQFCTSFTEPTFIHSNGKDSTTIDYILVHKPDTLKIGETERPNTLASNTSDHFPVLCSTQCTLIAKKQAVDISTSISQRIRWKLVDKNMYRAMVDDSLNEAQLKLSSILQVESAVSAIQHVITSTALMCSESKTLRTKKRRKRRFWTRDIKIAIRKNKEAHWTSTRKKVKEPLVKMTYRNADRFIRIKPCEVKVVDVLRDHKFVPNDCTISKCGTRNCKTCNILITDNSFSSNLTKRSFSTHSFENLSCKSYNVVYAIECALCGLMYVGETKGELRKRMNGHRSSIKTGGNQLLYKYFNLPDHSVLSMKVRILEKIYHPTNSPGLSTPFRRKREEHWIRQLGTTAPYGCNDHIDSIGILGASQ